MIKMGLKIYAGKTFHLPTPPAGKYHFWIAATDPDGIPEKFVMVNLTTKRSNSDTTVILDSKDHRFINHETVVYYLDARFVEVSIIQKAIREGISSFDDDCSNEVLERIQLGLMQSPFTPNKIKMYCREYLGYV